MLKFPLFVKLSIIAAAVTAMANFHGYAQGCVSGEAPNMACMQEIVAGEYTNNEICYPSDVVPPSDPCTFTQSCIVLPPASDGSKRCATSGCNPCDGSGGGGGGGFDCPCGVDPFTGTCYAAGDPRSPCFEIDGGAY